MSDGKTVKDLVIAESGDIVAKTMGDKLMKCEMMIRSGMLPSRYKTAGQVVVAEQYARELNLPPLTALKQIAVIKGTPTIYGDLPLAVVRSSGKLENIKELYLDKDGKVICLENGNLTVEVEGSYCYTKNDNGDERETFFTLKEAKAAGIFANVWLQYPKLMLKYRARGENLKDNFSDVLNGIGIGEYDLNQMSPSDTPIDYKETQDSDLNDRLEDVEPITIQAETVVYENKLDDTHETIEITQEEKEASADESISLHEKLASEQEEIKKDEAAEKMREPTELEILENYKVKTGKRKGMLLKNIPEDDLIKMKAIMEPIIEQQELAGEPNVEFDDLYDAVEKYLAIKPV